MFCYNENSPSKAKFELNYKIKSGAKLLFLEIKCLVMNIINCYVVFYRLKKKVNQKLTETTTTKSQNIAL